jgi:hypothetical protein
MRESTGTVGLKKTSLVSTSLKKTNPLPASTRNLLPSTTPAPFPSTSKIGFHSGKFTTCSAISATFNQSSERNKDSTSFSDLVILPLSLWTISPAWAFAAITLTSDMSKIMRIISKDPWNTASPFTLINHSTGFYLINSDSPPNDPLLSIHHPKLCMYHRSKKKIATKLH